MPWTTPPASGATVHIWNGYSLAERDRRWKAVRESAAKAGLDCIFVPLGNGVDGRYLTGPSMTSTGNTVDYDRFFKVLDQMIANARKKPGSK